MSQSKMTRYFTPVYSRRRSSATKKPAKQGRVAVTKLVKDVKRLKRDMITQKRTIYYRNSAYDSIGNATSNNVYTWPLFAYSSWTRVFGTDADDEGGKIALIKKSNLDLLFDTNGERASLDYTMYIVQLTCAGHEQLFNSATGGLAALTDAIHFSRAGTNGMAFLSKRFFNILACRRIITGTSGSLPTETASLRKRMYIKLNYNKGKGLVVQNPSGDWRTGASPQAPNTNTYIIVFNNDSTVDSAAKLAINALHTVQV